MAKGFQPETQTFIQPLLASLEGETTQTYGETESQWYQTKPNNAPLNWLVVSTHLKNISQIGNLP